jgi:hypothetical protein
MSATSSAELLLDMGHHSIQIQTPKTKCQIKVSDHLSTGKIAVAWETDSCFSPGGQLELWEDPKGLLLLWI